VREGGGGPGGPGETGSGPSVSQPGSTGQNTGGVLGSSSNPGSNSNTMDSCSSAVKETASPAETKESPVKEVVMVEQEKAAVVVQEGGAAVPV